MKVCIHIEMFQAQDARQVFLDYSGVHSRPLSSKNASCNFLLPLLACSSGRLTRIAHITCWKQNSACITTASSMYALCHHTTPLETRPQACLWHFIVGHTTSPKLQPEDTHCHYENRKWKKNPHNWKKKNCTQAGTANASKAEGTQPNPKNSKSTPFVSFAPEWLNRGQITYLQMWNTVDNLKQATIWAHRNINTHTILANF